MVKRVIWSANALSDRIQILSYWYSRTGTKTYSRKLDQKLKSAIKHLKKHPEIGRKLENRNERFLVRNHYQLFYTLKESEIHIVHIWDCRRNPNDFIPDQF